MKGFTTFSMAAALCALGVSAQGGNTNADSGNVTLQSNCRNQICYSMAVPLSTARNASGNIYFQIYAPDTFAWVGLGTGSSMADSNMFLIYQNSSGGITLSGRQADGRTMPEVPSTGGADLELLEGSGVDDGFMTANFRCSNCETWKRSALNFSSNATPMIGAWQEGDPMEEDDEDADIGKHTGMPRIFELDIRQAQVANDSNPFTGENAVPANATSDDDDDDAAAAEDDDSAGAGSTALLSSGLALAVAFAAIPFAF